MATRAAQANADDWGPQAAYDVQNGFVRMRLGDASVRGRKRGCVGARVPRCATPRARVCVRVRVPAHRCAMVFARG